MAKEYIDREEAINRIKKERADFEPIDICVACGVGKCVSIIREIPAADVTPVVNGRNVSDIGQNHFTCSECGLTIDGELYEVIVVDDFDFDKIPFRVDFCPRCGARIE